MIILEEEIHGEKEWKFPSEEILYGKVGSKILFKEEVWF